MKGEGVPKAFVFSDRVINGLDAALRECGFSQAVRYGRGGDPVTAGISRISSRKHQLALVELNGAGGLHGLLIMSDLREHVDTIIVIGDSRLLGGVQHDAHIARDADGAIADNNVSSLQDLLTSILAGRTNLD